MPRTASEEANTSRYDFSFAWESSYGHVVELFRRIDLEPGLILDLGCGVGAIAEPLCELGFEYVGADIDRDALQRITGRGLEAHELDLNGQEEIPARMLELANGRRVAAVLLLDVIEHMPETEPFLSAIRRGLDLVGSPPLVVSVPNVAHTDLGAKLVFGRWDSTLTGLLDSTHLQQFTSERLRAQAHNSGLLEVDAFDFKLRMSDQHFPADHPALAPASPVGATLRMWREAADSHGDTIQFVRAFVCAETARKPEETSPPLTSTSRLTVVMRTQGKRPTHLRDALTCLAAQTVDDFEVLLMLHSGRAEVAVPCVTKLVAEFDPSFSARVRVIHVAGGGRARPLNAALDRVSSDYVAFLDDDDLVTADWVEAFLDAAGDGVIVRSVATVRQVSPPEKTHCAPYLVHSPLEFRYELEFDRVHHLWGNETPICTFAVPRTLIEAFGLRFDEHLTVLEDWDFLMRCVAFTEVRDTRRVTSIYQMWRGGESSASMHELALWQATQRVLQGRRNTQPVVLPAGSVDRLVKMSEQLAELEATRTALASARTEANAHLQGVQQLSTEIGHVRDELKRVSSEYLITINSRRWRVLGPPARMLTALRRALRRLSSPLRASSNK
jgi:SAM-dependent methyltransferase